MDAISGSPGSSYTSRDAAGLAARHCHRPAGDGLVHLPPAGNDEDSAVSDHRVSGRLLGDLRRVALGEERTTEGAIMSHRIGNIVVITPTEDAKCELCGKIAEL